MAGVVVVLVALAVGAQAEKAPVGFGGGFGGGGYGGGGFGGGGKGIGGGGFGGGGFGGGFGGGGCIPQVHYKTHYRNQLNEVPVYKTVISKKLVLEPYTDYIYSTIYKENTLYLTKTEYVTNTDYLTRVTHRRYTETLSDVLYLPDYSTVTHSVTQYQPVLLTEHLYTTQIAPYAITTTQVETVYDTITKETVIAHQSEVPVVKTLTITRTTTKYHNIVVTATKIPYGDDSQDIVLFTSNIVKYKPSYVTKAYYQTQYITTTNIERVPLYVTQTVAGYCGPSGYAYSSPRLPFPGGVFGIPSAAGALKALSGNIVGAGHNNVVYN